MASLVFFGKGNVNALAVGTEWAVVGGCDSGVRLLRVTDATVARSWNASGSVECVALSPNQSLAAVGTEAGRVRVFAIPGGEVLGELPKAHADSVTTVAFVSDGLLASGSRDGTIRLWNWRDGKLTEVFQFRTTSTVIALAVTRDGTRLAAAVQGELGVRVWRLDRLREAIAALGLNPGY